MSKGTGHASGERRYRQHSEMSWAQTRTQGRKAKGAGQVPGAWERGPWGRVRGRGSTSPGVCRPSGQLLGPLLPGRRAVKSQRPPQHRPGSVARPTPLSGGH